MLIALSEEKRANLKAADPLYACRWICDAICENSKTVIIPGEFKCVDEARFIIHQYSNISMKIPLKGQQSICVITLIRLF